MAEPNPNATRDRAFPFVRMNHRPPKPRRIGLTEIRGPYYTPMGKRYLEDILETVGAYVNSLKFAGGSFALMPKCAVRELIDLCHRHDVLVSTGGFMEYILRQSCDAVGAIHPRVQGAWLRHHRSVLRLHYDSYRRLGSPHQKRKGWRPQTEA